MRLKLREKVLNQNNYKGEKYMENLNLKINGNEIKIKSRNKIEISEEIKTPQKLFLLLKKYRNEIEDVSAGTEKFDKEILSAVSSCKNFYYKDKKDRIGVSREDGDISLWYGNARIYTSNSERPCLSDDVKEMFYAGSTREIEPLADDATWRRYRKLFELFPLVKTEEQIFDLTFSAGEYIKIDKEVKNAPKLSLIIGKGFVFSAVNNETIDEITFHSEFCKPSGLARFKKADELLLRFKDTAIEFDDNDTMTCWHKGNEYAFCSDEMTDYDARVPAEEMGRDLKEIKKLLKLSLKFIDSKLIEKMIETVENSGELSEFESKMKILENFEIL